MSVRDELARIAQNAYFAPGGDDRHPSPQFFDIADAILARYAVVELEVLDRTLWRLLDDERSNAPASNYEENDYNAGFIAGISHAQVIARDFLPDRLAAANRAEAQQ